MGSLCPRFAESHPRQGDRPRYRIVARKHDQKPLNNVLYHILIPRDVFAGGRNRMENSPSLAVIHGVLEPVYAIGGGI